MSRKSSILNLDSRWTSDVAISLHRLKTQSSSITRAKSLHHKVSARRLLRGCNHRGIDKLQLDIKLRPVMTRGEVNGLTGEIR